MRYLIKKCWISGSDDRENHFYAKDSELGIVYKIISNDPLPQSAENLRVEVLDDFIESENTSSIPQETYEDTQVGWDRQESFDSDGRLMMLRVDTDGNGNADWEINYTYYPATSNIYQKKIEDFRNGKKIQYTYSYNDTYNSPIEGKIQVYEVETPDPDYKIIKKYYDHNGNLINEFELYLGSIYKATYIVEYEV